MAIERRVSSVIGERGSTARKPGPRFTRRLVAPRWWQPTPKSLESDLRRAPSSLEWRLLTRDRHCSAGYLGALDVGAADPLARCMTRHYAAELMSRMHGSDCTASSPYPGEESGNSIVNSAAVVEVGRALQPYAGRP